MNHAGIRSRALAVALVGALSLISAGRAVAQGEDDAEDGPSRVARLAYVSGDVSVFEPQGEDWQTADQNEALFEGTEIYVGDRGRAEIALGSRSYLRIANGADVTFTGLDSGWVQVTVASGTAVLSIESNARGGQYSLSAPAAAVTPNGAGSYRVDIADNGDTWVTLQRGTAELSTTAGAFQALEGDVATFSYDDPNDVDLVGYAAQDYQDDVDDWVAERTGYYDDLDRRDQPAPVLALNDRDDIYGLSELARYGTWLGLGDGQYGWQPQYGRNPDWSPYQDGYWDYSTVTGYTWVSNEPWGWAPYHYGRWNYDDRAGWVWLPTHGAKAGYGARDTARYQWKPALVYLWQAPDTNSYAWVPLAPGERYVPFSEPTIAAARRTQRAPVADFRPRYFQERRGVVSLSPTALASRQKPAKVARVSAPVTASVPTAQMVAPKIVDIPKPARAAVAVAPARVKPTVAVRQRAVVVDAAAAASAPKPTSATSQALRAQAKPARVERKAERRALKADRKTETAQQPTTAQPTAQPTQPTATGASPGVVRPGKRGGRKLDSGQGGVKAPAGDATGTPPARVNRGNGRNRDAAPGSTTTPAAQQPPAGTTTAPAAGTTTTDTPATTDPNAPARGKGRGQGKNKNRPKPGDPTAPTTTPPPPVTERPAPQ